MRWLDRIKGISKRDGFSAIFCGLCLLDWYAALYWVLTLGSLGIAFAVALTVRRALQSVGHTQSIA